MCQDARRAQSGMATRRDAVQCQCASTAEGFAGPADRCDDADTGFGERDHSEWSQTFYEPSTPANECAVGQRHRLLYLCVDAVPIHTSCHCLCFID